MIYTTFIYLLITSTVVISICILIKCIFKNTTSNNIETFKDNDDITIMTNEILKNNTIKKLLSSVDTFEKDIMNFKKSIEKFSTNPELANIEAPTLNIQLDDSKKDKRHDEFKRVIKKKHDDKDRHDVVIEEEDDDFDTKEDDDHDTKEEDDHDTKEEDDHDDNDDDNDDDDDTSSVEDEEIKTSKKKISKKIVENFTNNIHFLNKKNKPKNNPKNKTKKYTYNTIEHSDSIEGISCGTTANCFHYQH